MDEEIEEIDRPDEEDGFIETCYDHLAVSIGGKFLGKFNEHDEAIHAIRAWMDENRFWPNVWTISDHGNVSGPINLES